jgi:hypothetical protein
MQEKHGGEKRPHLVLCERKQREIDLLSGKWAAAGNHIPGWVVNFLINILDRSGKSGKGF